MANGAAKAPREDPVFVSEHPYRRLFVRSAIGVVAAFFVAWLVALVTGISGFGGLPGLEVKPDPGSASDDAPQAPASAAGEGRAGGGASAETIGDADPAGAGGAGTERRQAAAPGGGGGVAPTPRAPTAPGTGTATGPPDVTPGGNVPGANAGGNGNAYGGGTGGGRTQSG